VLSKEGQTILKERNRVPSSLSVDTHLNKFPFHMIDPVITLDENEKWEKLWSQLFLKGKKIEKESE
jgi:iron(III) transport system substrate-binding protein